MSRTPTLGQLELVVLRVVATLGEGAYGAGVRREVSTLLGRDYSVGAIYTTLSRLVDKGLAETWVGQPTAVRGGRSRRHYRLTGEGRATLADARRRAERLWDDAWGASPA